MSNNQQQKVIKYQQSSREKKMIIKNSIFTDQIIYNILPMGFALLSYLLYESRNTTDIFTTINIAMDILDIKMKKTIIGYFDILKKNNLITFTKNLSEMGIHDRFEVDLTQYYNIQGGFEQIPGSIFIDNYINENSWTILCLLCKMYHTDYGNAMLSQESIAYNTGIKHRKTIRENIIKLQEQKLITVIPNQTSTDPFSSGNGYDGYLILSKPCKYKINFYSNS